MLLKHFTTVSFYTALSRISGYVRDIFIAKYIGAGAVSDAFFIALRVPNFFRRFFAEGALNSAFIPIFSRELENNGREAAKKFAEEIFIFLFVVLVIFSSIFMIFMPYLIYLIAPGLLERPEIKDLTVELTRITFPYLMLVSIATLFASILNSISKFAAVAFMPVLYNLAIISALVGFGGRLSLENSIDVDKYFLVHVMAWGAFAGGILQIIWMIYFLKKNGHIITLKFRFLKVTDGVREFFRKVTPAAIGGGVVQINLWVDLMIASYFTGAVTYLYYADRVAQFPLSMIGTAMGTALLPMLSRKLGAGDIAEANKIHETGLEVVLLLTIPASFALMILPFDIMHVLFVRGEFTEFDSRMAAYAMAAFAMGLPAFALIKIFSSCFFALKDTKTPVISATIAMIINIVLNIIFVLVLRAFSAPPHIGIALATAIAGWFNAAYLGRKLFKTTHFSLTSTFVKRISKIMLSTFLMTIILLLLTVNLSSSPANLMIEVVIGGGLYLFMIFILKTFPMDELKPYLSRRKK